MMESQKKGAWLMQLVFKINYNLFSTVFIFRKKNKFKNRAIEYEKFIDRN